jgi:hypothetical protein
MLVIAYAPLTTPPWVMPVARPFGRSTRAGAGGALSGSWVARRVAMAKFAVFFSYRSETWDQMLKKPGDRTAAVRDLASR